MVTQNMLRKHEGKEVFSQKKFQFVTVFDLIKYLKQVKNSRDFSLRAHQFLSYHLK